MIETLFGLRNRPALVTGAGRGIGQAAAIGLAEAGADVALVSRTPEELTRTAHAIEALGRRALVISADLSDWSSAATIVDRVAEVFGGVDILINNAGCVVAEDVLSVTGDAMDRQISVNLRSAMELSRAAARDMIRRSAAGSIINVTSLAATIGTPAHAAYAISKSGLLIFTRTFATEMARAGHNIRANCVTPGWVDTGMSRAAGVQERAAFDPSEASGRTRQVLDRIPMGRPAAPEEMKGGFVFLASNASSYVTGQELVMDGGWLASGV